MERIQQSKEAWHQKENLMFRLFVEASTQLDDTSDESQKIWKAWFDDGKVDILLEVEGVELKLSKVLELWWGQVDRMITEEAAKMVNGKFYKVIEAVNDINENLSDARKECVRSLTDAGLELDDWGDFDKFTPPEEWED